MASRNLVYFLIFMFIQLQSYLEGYSDPVVAPRFVINLDLPPNDRFNEICKLYEKYVPEMKKAMSTKIPPKFVPAAEAIAGSIQRYIAQPYADEMRGISAQWNMSLGEVILTNLYYEWTAFCTSIIAQDVKRRIVHGRNLDYKSSDLLRNITMMLDYQRKGQIVYSGASFAGYIGLMTGQKPNHFTISVDERNQGFWWENVFEAIFSRKARTVGFFVRDLLNDPTTDFHDAVEGLANAALIAPVYFIVGGISPGEGVVITRGHTILKDEWFLDIEKGRWYLVETNYDHWTTPPPTDDRRHPAEKAMNTTGQENISPDTLFKVLSLNPVLNNRTAYTTIMSAANPDLFNTWVRYP